MSWSSINHISAKPRERAWLNYSGSTTQALETETKKQLKIKVLSQNWGFPTPEEAQCLNLAEGEQAIIREIFMATPKGDVMFCRSIFPKSALSGKETDLTTLGNKPLGKILFGKDHWQRSPFQYRTLYVGDALYEKAYNEKEEKPPYLLARRSTFQHDNKKVLITEVFLPELYRCKLNKLSDYVKLMRLNKPIGILLAAWPSFWALWLAAKGLPSIKVLMIFIVGAILARSAGCIINDYADRHFDEHVKRTQLRPLATKKISKNIALSLFAVLGLISLGLTLLLNRFAFEIALLTALCTALYPLLKRVTHLPQLGLGLVFNAGILIAFAAVQNQLPVIAWILYAASICWTLAYDTMYAMTDRQDDIKIGIKSTAILFKQYDIFAISLLLIATFALLILVGCQALLGAAYYCGLLIAAGISVQQVIGIRKRLPKHCFQAFLTSNRVGLMIFLGLVINYL